jgi:hypothetical protein
MVTYRDPCQGSPPRLGRRIRDPCLGSPPYLRRRTWDQRDDGGGGRRTRVPYPGSATCSVITWGAEVSGEERDMSD